MAQLYRFEPYALPQATNALRSEVRAFVADALAGTAPAALARSWSASNPEFSRALGARGWIGMTWPARYGGGERSMLERYVVLEELLAAGAPVGAHWIADRQSGPLLLRYGSEDQRARFLPAIARGELYFCIGMSEPGSGSDLASIRSTARRTKEGWRLSGQKIWTTNAHLAHYMIALVRTAPAQSRHDGFSQFVVDLSAPGVTVRPIVDMVGDHHFNEVFLDDVLVGDTELVGEEGAGWTQVTAELSLERSGPERYLSSYRLFHELVAHAGDGADEPTTMLIGRIAAELWTLRQMSLAVAAQLAQGEDPAIEAAMVKDLGNGFEQRLPQLVQAMAGGDVDLVADSGLNDTLAFLLQASPSFSLRGGTREILRGIVARGLDLR